MIAKIEKILLLRHYIILIFLVGIIFVSSVENSFLSLDDTWLIVDNPNINLSLKKMPTRFTSHLFKLSDSPEQRMFYSSYYRPILSLLYVLNYKMWGINPIGFHLTNILLHLASTIVLYRVGIFLFSDKIIPLLAASIFAVHPVHHEVLGRVALGENIYGLFIILSLYFFLKEKLILSLSAFSIALFSKESAVMLPFALAILSIQKRGLKSGILFTTPYAALVGIYLIIRAIIVESVFGGVLDIPTFTQIITMFIAVSDYMRLLIIPFPVSPFYPARLYPSIFEPKFLFAIIILLLVSLLILKLRNDKTMFFLILSPLIMLVPGILKVNALSCTPDLIYIADRLLYVPAMFFSLFVSAFTLNIRADKSKKYVIIGWTIIIALFTFITASTVRIYKDDFIFYKKIAEESPHAISPHIELGHIYHKMGKLDNAIKEYNTALKPPPTYKTNITLNGLSGSNTLWEYQPALADTHFSIGLVYLEKGNIEKATRKFKVATILRPNFVDAHYNLGNVYQKQGRMSDAIKEYETVLKIDSKHADAHQNLEILNIKKKQLH